MSNQLKNKLFLVAIPSGKLLYEAQSIQAKLNDKYKLYNPFHLPPLHVTIDHLSIEDEEDYYKATQIIQKICDKTPAFNLSVNGFSFFYTPHKSINLYVEKTTKLKNLAGEIHTILNREKLSNRPDYTEWEFHISLINTVFASRDWSDEEFSQALEYVKQWDLNLNCRIEWLELWKPQYKPQLIIEEFFPLKG